MMIVVGTMYYAIPLGIVGKSFSEVWDFRHLSLLHDKMARRLKFFGCTVKDLPRILQNFYSGDTGGVDFYDFEKLLKNLHIRMDKSETMKLFVSLDQDSDGVVSDQEFVRK